MKYNLKSGLTTYASITFDQTLIDQDIEGSIAHATMLANQGIISQQDSEQIIQGLKSIQHDDHQDQFNLVHH